MPAGRKYDTPAQRQAAYRARQRAGRDELSKTNGIPPLPAIPAMPGHRRWEAMLRMALLLVVSTHGEMRDYFDDRSESWRESDKAEAFVERADELVDLIDSFEAIGISALTSTKEDTDAA